LARARPHLDQALQGAPRRELRGARRGARNPRARAREGLRGVLPRRRRPRVCREGQRPGPVDRQGIRDAAPRAHRDPHRTRGAFPHLPAAAQGRRGRGGGVKAGCALLLAATIVAGCATVQNALPPSLRISRAEPAPTTGTELVAYLARLRGMNERGLATEVPRQRELSRGAPSALSQVNIAIALSLVPQADEGEILALVEPV